MANSKYLFIDKDDARVAGGMAGTIEEADRKARARSEEEGVETHVYERVHRFEVGDRPVEKKTDNEAVSAKPVAVAG